MHTAEEYDESRQKLLAFRSALIGLFKQYPVQREAISTGHLRATGYKEHEWRQAMEDWRSRGLSILDDYARQPRNYRTVSSVIYSVCRLVKDTGVPTDVLVATAALCGAEEGEEV